jgi:hypothetical protein
MSKRYDVPILLRVVNPQFLNYINPVLQLDGLEELLKRNSLTLKLLLDAPVSGLAKILGIDNYVTSIIHHAARKV